VPTHPRLLTPPFVVAWLSTFFVLLAIGMLMPVLPLYAKGPLDQGSVGVGLAVAAASPTALLLQPLAGRLGDRRGRRVLVVVGALVYAATVSAYALVDTLPALAALRLASGAGEALVFVGGATVINDLAPEGRRGEAVSLYSLAVWGGLALGPLAGELVLGEGRYDAVWLAAAGLAVVAAAVGLALPETRPAGAGESQPGGYFHRAALTPGLVLVATMVGFAGFSAFMPLYARELGLGGAGAVFAVNAVVVVAIRSVGRKIPDRVGSKRAATAALVLVASGFTIIAAVQMAAGLYVGTVVLALGQALTFPALMTMAVGAAPATERSAVVGSFSAFADVGYAIGAVSLGAVASATGYAGVFVVAAVLAVAGLVPLSRLRPPPVPATAVAADAPP
jgi:MFS family permease